MNPGDNSVFYDLMYGTWDTEERRELDRLAAQMPDHELSSLVRARIAQYGWGDPGDEDDQERRAEALARLRRDLDRFDGVITHRPSWLDAP